MFQVLALRDLVLPLIGRSHLNVLITQVRVVMLVMTVIVHLI